jgi:thiamine kinase-like enzyme
LIDRLPPGHGLCHGDLHHGNVIITADGPRLIDWTCSIRAPAAFDLAWSHILLTELFAETADDQQRSLAIDAAAQSEYARGAGLSPATLTAAMELCLPIVLVRLFILLGPKSARWERLMQRVEAALRAEG